MHSLPLLMLHLGCLPVTEAPAPTVDTAATPTAESPYGGGTNTDGGTAGDGSTGSDDPTGSTGSTGTSGSGTDGSGTDGSGTGGSGSQGSTGVDGSNGTPDYIPPDLGQCATLTAPEPTSADPRMARITQDRGQGDDTCGMSDIRFGSHIATLNIWDLQRSHMCGACARVTGPAGSTIVKVVEHCAGCVNAEIKLSQQAYYEVAGSYDSFVMGEWELVSCDLDTPLQFKWHDSAGPGWTAVQIRDSNWPVEKLEILYSAGNSYELYHGDYAHFIADHGLGPPPFTFRITDRQGAQVVSTGVAELGGAWVPSGVQFPSCDWD